ncbi:fibulin-5 [Pelobates cultripes]|uniref:Fibulin-5, partial n=1 Tax=Pelobates cultripes TaxID=61616 RepID=A0AAD1TLM0_PELCU|nr:fibulin-5 [Pelobates cultripes]
MLKLRLLPLLTLILCLTDSGNAQTQCNNGFEMDRSSGQCLDVDECRTISDACRGDMMCVNQNGGYLCIPRTGTTFRSQYRNSFLPAVAPLPSPNFPSPSRPLICRFGYQLDDNGQCVDIDECVSETHHCNPTQICINTEGGYTCSCTEGYWLLEGQCLALGKTRSIRCTEMKDHSAKACNRAWRLVSTCLRLQEAVGLEVERQQDPFSDRSPGSRAL